MEHTNSNEERMTYDGSRSCSRETYHPVAKAAGTGIRRLTIHPAHVVCVALAFWVQTANASPIYFNGFETNTAGWNDFGGSFDATRVASGANGITSASGDFHAESSAEGSAGSWGGYNFGAGNGVPTVFQEYWTSVDIFLNVTGGWANDTRFDFNSAINNSGGTFHRSFIFNAGFYNDNTGPGSGSDRFIISAGNNSQPGSAFAKNPAQDPIAVYASGWYRFEHHFYESAGTLVVDMSIFDTSQTLVKKWTLSDPTDLIADMGGNRYGWFDYNQFSTLAFDNASLTVVSQPVALLFTAIHLLPPDSMVLVISNTPNAFITLQTSFDLLLPNWTTMATTTRDADSWTYTNAAASDAPQRFYRAFITP